MSSESARDDGGLRVALLIGYGLFAVAPFNGATAIAGVILAYLKRDEARGTVFESHVRNLIHVFWIGVVFAVLLLAVILQGVGGLFYSLFATNGHPPAALVGFLVVLVPALWLVCSVFAIWFYYRTLRGLIRALEDRPY